MGGMLRPLTHYGRVNYLRKKYAASATDSPQPNTQGDDGRAELAVAALPDVSKLKHTSRFRAGL